jgi:hypothetical protein
VTSGTGAITTAGTLLCALAASVSKTMAHNAAERLRIPKFCFREFELRVMKFLRITN